MPTTAEKKDSIAQPLYRVEDFVIGQDIGVLLARVRQRMAASFDEELADLSLSSAQLQIIGWIRENPGQTAAELCRAIGMDTGAMKRMLDRIEKKGFISRVASKKDRRIYGLELTQKGEDLLPVVVPKVVKNLNGMMAGFNRDELEVLQSMLLRVLANQ